MDCASTLVARVDYDSEGLALSASLFHVRLAEAVHSNPLYFALNVPNFLKELVGWKTQ